VIPAQSLQTGIPEASRPGSSRSARQPGQDPCVRVALSKQVRQIGPSDQFAAFAACRPQRAQVRICQRSYFSRVSWLGLTARG
jgi:hypothetical protein